MKQRKRIAALLMAGAMLFNTMPMNALAVENPDTGGLCEHHPEHTAECGYTEGMEGTPCQHEHNEDCYALVENCVHSHTDECYPQEDVSDHVATPSDAEQTNLTECAHACSEESGCITKKFDCKHEHDSECGYTEAVRGTPCKFVCKECNAETGNQEKDGCICDAPCTDDAINTDCPICGPVGADLTACKGGVEQEKPQQITITEFDPLDEDVANQIISAEKKLNLPDTLGASGYVGTQDSGGAEHLTIGGVTWESDPAYDENAKQGAWLFTAVLPEGYTLLDDVELPEISVMAEPVNLLANTVAVNYLACDTDGANWTTTQATATLVTSSDTAWGTADADTDSWYVAQDSVEISSRITVTGNVHLILTNGCHLNATKGIGVPPGNSLTIYAQSTGADMGRLTAKGNESNAGIGGTGNQGISGNVTINGGIVNAIGGSTPVSLFYQTGAGIGSAYAGYNGGTVTINGGSVTADGSPGIGAQPSGYNAPSQFYTGTGDGILIKTSSFGGYEDGALHKDDWHGIIFQGSEGKVYGNQAFTGVLEISKGETLTIPDSVTLTNNGTIINKDKIVIEGTGVLDNQGTLQNSGAIEGSVSGTPLQVTVTFDPAGGTLASTEQQFTYNGTYSGLPTPARPGYTFAGWFTGAEGGELVTSTTTVTNPNAHTLYASWTANNSQVTVTFSADGNPVTERIYGEPLTITATARTSGAAGANLLAANSMDNNKVKFTVNDWDLGTADVTVDEDAGTATATLTLNGEGTNGWGSDWTLGADNTVQAEFGLIEGLNLLGSTGEAKFTVKGRPRTVTVWQDFVTDHSVGLSVAEDIDWWDITYGYSTMADGNNITWKEQEEDGTFMGLNSNTTYYFWVKVAEDDYYAAATSAPLAVTTEPASGVEGLWLCDGDIYIYNQDDRMVVEQNYKEVENPSFPLRIVGRGDATTTHGIDVRGATVGIILDGVRHKTVESYSSPAPIRVMDNAKVTLTLEGENVLESYYTGIKGISVKAGSSLTIQGSGALSIGSSDHPAEIGIGESFECGNVTVNGGTLDITATDVGIGAITENEEHAQFAQPITINGGVVKTHIVNADGVVIGIQDEYFGRSGDIDIAIKGGTVLVDGEGKHIRAHSPNGSGGSVTITGGSVSAAGISPAPTNGDNAVTAVTVSTGKSNAAVEDFRLDGTDYGAPAQTDSEGNLYLYLYLPQDSTGYTGLAIIGGELMMLSISADGTAQAENVALPANLTATYGQTLADVSLPDGWTWSDTTTSVGNVGSHTFDAVYAPADTTISVTQALTVAVGKAAGTASVTMADYKCGDDMVSPAPESATNGTKKVTYQYKLTSAEEGAYSNTKPTTPGVYTVKATFAATDNYNTVTATAIFTVSHELKYHAGTAATCTAAGNVEYWSCSGCNKNFSDEDGKTELQDGTIPELGHDWDAWKTNNNGTHSHLCKRDNNHTRTESCSFGTGDTCSICGGKKPVVTPPATKYNVTVNGSYSATSGEGSYEANKTVTIDAGSRSNYRFNGWTSSDGITFADAGSSRTTFTMSGKDVTVTANWKYTGDGSSGGNTGGGNTGGDSDSDSGGSTIIDRPTEKHPDIPTTSETKPVKPDKNGNVTIGGDSIQDAVNKGNKDKGIAVTVPVNNAADAGSLTITLTAETLDKLVTAKVRKFDITTNGLPSFSFTLDTLKMLDKQSLGGDLILRLTKATVASKQAKEAVGTRSAYDITLVFIKDGKETPFTDWQGKTVSVKLPYTPAKGEQAGNLYAVYVDTNGKVEWLTKSSYNADQKAVIFEASHFSVYGVGYKNPAPVFTDITGHWAADNIIFAVSRGLLAGTGNNQFSPDTGMTRGMFVTALGRLAEIDPESYKTRKFTDVKADACYAPYVNWAVEKGIVNGTSTTTFTPDTNITREQMAVIMANYAKKTGYDLPVIHEAVTFADNAQISSLAAKEVKAMQQAGIMAGKGGNRFDPQGTATRAEVATVLRRFVETVIDPQTANGWVQNDSGEWSYYKNGEPVKGWLSNEQKWYWLDKVSGKMFSGGWKQSEGKWYYFYADGSMAVRTKVDGYEVGADGARK